MENPALAAMKNKHQTRACRKALFLQDLGGKGIHLKSHPWLSLMPFEFAIPFSLLPIKLFNQKPLKSAGELFLAYSFRTAAHSLLTATIRVQRAGLPTSHLDQVG